MTTLLPSRRFWIPVFVLLAASFIVPREANAQTLEVEFVSIANGEVNVPIKTEVAIKFSDAISTIGLSGAGLAGLPIDLSLVNEGCASLPALITFLPAGCAESWSLEDDGKTLVLENVELLPDQVHTLLILFAISTSGEVLDGPTVVRFGTGSTIPQGSVSGNVSSPDVDVEGAIVALTNSSVLDIISAEDTVAVEPLFGFADESGNYTVAFAPDGDYFALGIQLDFGILGDLVAPASKVAIDGVGVGLHDGDDDGIADLVTIAGEGATSGIDVKLSSKGSTIKDLQAPIEAMIVAEQPTARMSFGAGAGLEADGTGLTWIYIFTDLISGQAWLSAGIGQVAFPPERFDENEDLGPIALLLATAQFTDYADSDKALEWFRAAGGQEFLETNPGAIGAGILMDRLLFDLLLEILEGGDLEFLPGREVWLELSKYDHVMDGLDNVFAKTQSLEAWIVVFIGTTSEVPLHLVAMGDDGTPLLVIGSSPAGENAAAADAAAAAWGNDADLISVDGLGLPVASDGSAVMWAYNYYSAAKDSVLTVFVSGGEIGGVLTQVTISKDDVDSVEPLISNWIDSPEAIEAADDEAADFLATHVGVTSTATLVMGLQPNHPDRGIWRVTYTGGSNDGTTEERIVDIDASNGVSVAVEDDRTLPGSFALDQNYPNPFNPETVIGYLVAENDDVNLTIFNLLGQEVRVLVTGNQTEGAYKVRWDARDGAGNLVPSGVYLYRLEAANSVETRRMTLVR